MLKIQSLLFGAFWKFFFFQIFLTCSLLNPWMWNPNIHGVQARQFGFSGHGGLWVDFRDHQRVEGSSTLIPGSRLWTAPTSRQGWSPHHSNPTCSLSHHLAFPHMEPAAWDAQPAMTKQIYFSFQYPGKVLHPSRGDCPEHHSLTQT